MGVIVIGGNGPEIETSLLFCSIHLPLLLHSPLVQTFLLHKHLKQRPTSPVPSEISDCVGRLRGHFNKVLQVKAIKRKTCGGGEKAAVEV